MILPETSNSKGATMEKWYSNIDETAMTLTMFGEFDNVPFRWELCLSCEGRGFHVNHSIDGNGLTASDIARIRYEDGDDDFLDDYFAGAYDVPCYECGGRRVVPHPVNIEDIKMWEHWKKSEAETAAIHAAERAMGA